MPEFADVPQRPHVYRGPLAFNQRSVLQAIRTLDGHDDTGQPLRGREMSLLELANVLLLLESLAMSNAMYVDGTLPPKDLELLAAAEEAIKNATGVDLRIDRISPRREDLGYLFQEAAETACLSIEELLTRPEPPTDDPLKGDITRFVADLQRGATDRMLGNEIASQIADDAASGRETYRGSKCVAGVLLANVVDGPDICALAAERLGAADDAAARRLAGALINRFRINYLNSIAGFRDAAYLADVSIESLKAAQVVMFWRFLTRKLAERHKIQLSDAPLSAMDRQLAAAPLGIAILMNTRGGRPADLLIEALRVRDYGFVKFAAETTPQLRHVHELSASEFEGFQDYLFRGQLGDLLDRSVRENVSKAHWRQLFIPAAFGASVGGAVGSLAGESLLRSSAVAVAAMFSERLTANLLEGKFGRAKAHLDSYRRLDKYLMLAAQQSQLGPSVESKVRDVFGRSLSPPPEPSRPKD